MVDSYQKIKSSLQVLFPDVPIEFLESPLGPESLQRAPRSKRISIFCDSWNPSSTPIGQGAGYHLWKVLIRNGTSRSLEERWMNSKQHFGLVAVGQEVRRVLEGLELSPHSSPLTTEGATAYNKGNFSGAWEERFREYLSPPSNERAMHLHSLVKITTLAESIFGYNSFPISTDDTMPLVDSYLLAQLPDFSIRYLGIVTASAINVVDVNQSLSQELPEGTQIFSCNNVTLEPRFPATEQQSLETDSLLFGKRLNGELNSTWACPTTTKFQRTYAPLLKHDVELLTSLSNSKPMLVLRNGQLVEEFITAASEVEKISNILYKMHFIGTSTHYAELFKWLGEA